MSLAVLTMIQMSLGSSTPENTTETGENPITRACDSCRSRKIKCDRKEPCLQCTLRDVVCVYSARKKRKRRLPYTNFGHTHATSGEPVESVQADQSRPVQQQTRPIVSDSQNTDSQQILQLDDSEYRNRLDAIEYHLQQLSILLDQEEAYKARRDHISQSQQLYTTKLQDWESENSFLNTASLFVPPQEERSGSVLLAKVHEQLQSLGESSLHSAFSGQDSHLGSSVASGASRNLVSRSSGAQVDTPRFGTEIADSVEVNAHRPWLPNEEDGLKLLDIYIYKVMATHCIVSGSLARGIRDAIYSPSFTNGEFFVQRLACASYMMVEALPYADSDIHSQAINEAPIKAVLYRNIFLILRNVRILLVPSLLNIQALLIAAITAKQLFSPALCWTIISHACRHCLDLGLHRQTGDIPPLDYAATVDAGMIYDSATTPKSERSRLFWLCFIFDKMLSLTYGRSPSFHTKECAVPVPLWEPCSPSTLGYGKYRYLIELAFLHDAIYTRLYSATAEAELASLGPEGSIERTRKRAEAVMTLHNEVDTLMKIYRTWIADMQNYESTETTVSVDELMEEVEYRHCVCLTMIHRVHGAASAQSRDIYIKASRRAVELLRRTLSQQPSDQARLATTSSLVVFQPFAPFFGIFSAIADNVSGGEMDDTDLSSLEFIADELQKLNGQANGNGVIRRLSRLASEFTDVAREITSTRKETMAHVQNNSSSGAFQVNAELRRDTLSDIALYCEAARQITLPSWLEFLSDEMATSRSSNDWLEPELLREKWTL